MADNAEGDRASAKRKPSSEWKKTERLKVVREKEPDFIGKAELAHHLQCHISTIDEWIADGTIPPPHSRPGDKHPIWLRRHYNAYRETRRWPKESWWGTRD